MARALNMAGAFTAARYVANANRGLPVSNNGLPCLERGQLECRLKGSSPPAVCPRDLRSMSKIHISQSGEAPIQYPEQEVQAMLSSGRIPEDTIYWKEGMSDWRPLRELFPPVPPAPLVVPAPPGRSGELSPYAPPSVDPVPAPPVLPPGRYSFTKNPRGLTRLLKVMLGINGVILLLSLWGDFSQLQLANGGPITPEAANANDTRQGILGTLIAISYYPTVLVFGMWIYRANLNCRGFGVDRMQFTPGWAVGWYFIPFANLVLPFQVMKEIWKVSSNPRHWQSEAGSPLLGWWWGLWISRNILTQAAGYVSKSVHDMETLRTATVFVIVATTVNIFLVAVAIKMISRIFAMQVRLVETPA